MAKARPRGSSGAPLDGTANGGGKAETPDVPVPAAVAPEVPGPDKQDVYEPGTEEGHGQEVSAHEEGYVQPEQAEASEAASQWPSTGPGGWDGDGTGVWDPATEWGGEGQGEAWEEEPAWEGTPEAGTWEQQGPGAEQEIWLDRPWSGPEYEPGYTTSYARSRDEALAAYEDYGTAVDPAWGRNTGQDRRRPRARGNGPWPELVVITAVAVIVAAVILAVTSADRTSVAGPQAAVTTLPAVTAQRPHAPSPTASVSGKSPSHISSSATSKASRGAATSTPAPSTAAKSKAVSQRAKNLTVTAGVEQSLVKSWLAANPGGVDIGPKDVAGTVPHQLFYAEQPLSATYWALAVFKPSATLLTESSTAAGQAKLAQFQNSVYVFSWKAGPVWTLLGEVSAGSCPDAWVPKTVLRVWGLCGQ